MEVILNAVSGVVNCHIGEVLEFHDTLNRFRSGKGTWTTYLEANLLHQLISMMSEVISQNFRTFLPGGGSVHNSFWLKYIGGDPPDGLLPGYFPPQGGEKAVRDTTT